MEVNKTLQKGLRRRPDGTMIIDKWVNGVHIWKTLGKISDREAERILSIEMAASQGLVSPTLMQTGIPLPKNTLTVKDIVVRYWDNHVKYLASNKRAESCITNIIERLGNENVMAMRKDRIRKYLRDRQRERRVHWYIKRDPISGKKMYSNNEPVWDKKLGTFVGIKSAKDELKMLRAAINDAVENGILQNSPFPSRIDWGDKKQNEPVILDEAVDEGDTWNAIYQNASDEIKPVLLTLYETGMRPCECFALRWSWISEIEEDKWIISVPDIENLENGTQWREKTCKKRRIPISLKLLKLLKPIRKFDSSLVFPSPVFLKKTGEEKMRDNIKTAWNTAIRRAGLQNKNLTPYCLRRTRLSIWDQIDSDCSRYCGGHVPSDVHGLHYIKYTNSRIFKLVNLEIKPQLKLLHAAC